LAKLSAEQAEEKLSAVDLDYIILDTVDFKPDFPKLTIVEQEPKAGAKVKEGRKIYIKINACLPADSGQFVQYVLSYDYTARTYTIISYAYS
jgi:beta-lactam-binding protein with PASTA domain